jgi:hypothetical protein
MGRPDWACLAASAAVPRSLLAQRASADERHPAGGCGLRPLRPVGREPATQSFPRRSEDPDPEAAAPSQGGVVAYKIFLQLTQVSPPRRAFAQQHTGSLPISPWEMPHG